MVMARVRNDPVRRRRLWSAVLGLALLAIGFGRKASGRTNLPVKQAAARVEGGTKNRAARFEIIRLLYNAMSEHRVVSIAAGVTFFVLLAIFPAIAALVSIYGIFADPGTIRSHLEDLSSFLPGGAIEIIGDQLERVASGGKTTLGATFIFTLGLSVWSANAGMRAVFDALNIVYDAEERRGLIKLNAISLAFTIAALLVMLVAVASVVVFPVVINYAGLETVGSAILKVARWPALYAIVVLA